MIRRGFTLLETIVTSFIVSMILIFVLNLFPAAMTAVRRSESEVQANLLATSLLEQFRAQTFADLKALPDGDITIDGTAYRYTTKVGPVTDPASDPKYLKRAMVNVTWKVRQLEHTVKREIWIHALKR